MSEAVVCFLCGFSKTVNDGESKKVTDAHLKLVHGIERTRTDLDERRSA